MQIGQLFCIAFLYRYSQYSLYCMPTAPQVKATPDMSWNYTAGVDVAAPPWKQQWAVVGAYGKCKGAGKGLADDKGKAQGGKPLVEAFSTGKGKLNHLPPVLLPPGGVPAGLYPPKDSQGKVYLPLDRWCQNQQCPYLLQYGQPSQIRNHLLVSFPKTWCKHCKWQVLDPDNEPDAFEEQFIWRNQRGMVIWPGGPSAECFHGSKLYQHAEEGWSLDEILEYLRNEAFNKAGQQAPVQQQAGPSAWRGSGNRSSSKGHSSSKGNKGGKAGSNGQSDDGDTAADSKGRRQRHW